MRLRDALDLCTDRHSDDWVEMPSAGWGRPATAMLAGIFDPGAEDPRPRPLMGHSIVVYEPDARLSIVWPVPEDDDEVGRARSRDLPEWAEQDTHEWKSARPGWAVILLGGAPIWQELVWYLDWGSGIGGYVANFQPVYSDDVKPGLKGWEVSAWDVGLAGLINTFAATGEFYSFEPTRRLVPQPSSQHPVDAQRPEL